MELEYFQFHGNYETVLNKNSFPTAFSKTNENDTQNPKQICIELKIFTSELKIYNSEKISYDVFF